MPIKPCVGEAITNDVDEILDLKEDYVATAKGTGRLTEDKFNSIMAGISEIRNINNRMKCILETVQESTVNPETIVEEIHNKQDETTELTD